MMALIVWFIFAKTYKFNKIGQSQMKSLNSCKVNKSKPMKSQEKFDLWIQFFVSFIFFISLL